MISMEEFRSQLSIPPSKDEMAKRLRDVVVSLWEDHTRRKWSKDTVTKQFIIRRPLTDRTLFLNLYPIVAVVSVKDGASQADLEVVTPTDYFVDHDAGTIERFGSNWNTVVEVNWTGGYEEVDDMAIREALIVQARFLLNRHSDDKIAMASQGFQGGSSSFLAADLHPFFKRVARSKEMK
jgi:hypothetical protein